MKLGTFQQSAGLIAAVLICFATAGLGGLVTTPQIPNWYADLAKPTWTPPGWIFGPVWTLLYGPLAVAATLGQPPHGHQPETASAGAKTVRIPVRHATRS